MKGEGERDASLEREERGRYEIIVKGEGEGGREGGKKRDRETGKEEKRVRGRLGRETRIKWTLSER